MSEEDSASSSVQRAFALLRALAATRGKGERVTSLAKATGLTQATAHRLLQTLVAQRVVEQDAGSKNSVVSRARSGLRVTIRPLPAPRRGASALRSPSARSRASRTAQHQHCRRDCPW